MEQDLNTSKTAARPSHSAIEDKVGIAGSAEEQKIDDAAMRGAKRAENRILNDEGNLPGSSIFTK